MLANNIPTTFLTCNIQRKRVWELTTPQYHSSFHGGWLRSVLAPQSAELALLSDISKLDCTGLKIDPFCNRWAYIAVFWLILKWKSHAIA